MLYKYRNLLYDNRNYVAIFYYSSLYFDTAGIINDEPIVFD
jgi:hypothetical protein